MRTLAFIWFVFISPALAHFQVLLPSSDILSSQKSLHVELAFMHPFEQTYMQMQKPQAFGYVLDGKKTDLSSKLSNKKVDGLDTWQTDVRFSEMGDYLFFVDPQPYFEASEGKFIRHITKTIVDVYNAGEGWDKAIGLKAEIIPLVRPYGLYSGNIFSGLVLYKGLPAVDATIEVEYLNLKGLKAPSEMHITQVLKTDSNGVFHFVMPKAGWWGFAALLEDDKKIQKDGIAYPVELGAVLWLKTYEMP